MYFEWRDVTGTLVQWPVSPDMEPITIGRNPGSTVYSKETTVSRNHGRIGWDDQGYYIKDLGSSNGTFINGERTQRGVIREGDTVRCGEVLEILAKPGSLDKKGGAAPRNDDRPVQKALPTGAIRPEDSARLRDAVAAKQASQQPNQSRGADPQGAALQAAQGLVASQADRVKDMSGDAMRGGAAPIANPGISSPTMRRADPPPSQAPALSERPVAGRASLQTGQRDAVSMRPAASAVAGSDPELQRKVRALEQALGDAEARASRAETELKTIEPRAMRYSVELEGLSEKYVKLKEHNQVITRELEKTRSELRQREDDAFEAERKATELEQQINAARERATDATEQLSGLKVRLTQKDRQIEELQRQLDLLEYELRAARDENESLQSSFNREGSDSNRLERKINLLQEVIQEKESHIEQLRIDLRDKDIEIRQVRMGVGISDLEHEKRRLLEDYHNATRRVDELNDRMLQQSRQMDGLRAELDGAKAAAERKPVALVDVSEHPDFKAKTRETERLREELSGVQKELARSELKLESAQQDTGAAKQLEAELDKQRKTVEVLEQKLHDVEKRLNEALTANEKAAKSAVLLTPEMEETMEALADAVAASKSNATLVRRYAQQMEKQKAASPEVAEAVELMNDIAIVLAQDLSEQERMVTTLRRDLAGKN